MDIPDLAEGESGDILLGPHAVGEALRGGRRKIRRILLARHVRDARLGEIVLQAGRQRIPVRQVTRDRLAALAGTHHHQGIIALADPFPYADPEDVAAGAAAESSCPLLVALDGIEDPQNLGGILRTAEIFGVGGVLLSRHRAAGVTASVLRAASGAAEHLPIARAGNMAACLARLKAMGYWICGADVTGGVPLHQADLNRSLTLVLGGESLGLRRVIREQCDMRVSIPMAGRVGSLNVGVAAAIVLYEALRQRSLAPAEKNEKSK